MLVTGRELSDEDVVDVEVVWRTNDASVGVTGDRPAPRQHVDGVEGTNTGSQRVEVTLLGSEELMRSCRQPAGRLGQANAAGGDRPHRARAQVRHAHGEALVGPLDGGLGASGDAVCTVDELTIGPAQVVGGDRDDPRVPLLGTCEVAC